MTPDTHRTHWALQGLPLMPEWQAYRKLRADGRIAWAQAVIDRYGPQCRLEWVTDGCRVNHNELYRYEEDGE